MLTLFQGLKSITKTYNDDQRTSLFKRGYYPLNREIILNRLVKAYLLKGGSILQKECIACASFSDVLCQDWAGHLGNADLIYYGVNSILLIKLRYYGIHLSGLESVLT